MAELQYVCPNCAAPIQFDIRRQVMACGYCLSSFTVEEVEAYSRAQEKEVDEDARSSDAADRAVGEGESFEFDGQDEAGEDSSLDEEEPVVTADQIGGEQTTGTWEVHAGSTLDAADQAKLTLLECNQCGARIEEVSEVISTRCPYCNNTLVAISRIEATRVPDVILPFKIEREQMIAAFQKASKGRPLLPPQFRDAAVIREAVGMYVPFWLYDGLADGSASLLVTSVETHRGVRQKKIITQEHAVTREGSVAFQGIPVCASKQLPRERSDAIEPFDAREIVPFKTAYLAGYAASSFTIPAEQTREVGEARAKETLTTFLTSHVKGDSVSVVETQIEFRGGRVRYALLPIWMLNIEYEGTLYQFMINGQSGEVVGEFPVSKRRLLWRRLAYFAAGFLGGGILTETLIALVRP